MYIHEYHQDLDDFFLFLQCAMHKFVDNKISLFPGKGTAFSSVPKKILDN